MEVLPNSQAELADLQGRLQEALGPELVALLRFGAGLQEHARSAQEPDELLVVLSDTGGEPLRKLGAALGPSWGGRRLAPMVLTLEEIRGAADVFPVRFRAMQRSHQLLHGDNPLEGLEIAREHLRLRVEMELRNLSLRLRQRYLAAQGDALEALQVLKASVWPLCCALRGLLDLVDPSSSLGEHPDAVFPAVSARFDLSARVLDRLGDLWNTGDYEQEAGELFLQTLDLARDAACRADQLEVN